MKKIFALVLIVVIMISLVACGSPNETEVLPETLTTEPEKLTADTLAGTYKANLWFLEHSITLNANSTYDYGTTDKGTFKLDGNNIDFYNKEGYVQREYIAGENCIYQTDKSWTFTGDEEYNLAFSPDENGRADQTFIGNSMDKIPGCEYNWIVLDLNTDGSFELKLGNRSKTAVDIIETFKGTYKSSNATLTLSCDGKDSTLILGENNQIHFMVYEKI